MFPFKTLWTDFRHRPCIGFCETSTFLRLIVLVACLVLFRQLPSELKGRAAGAQGERNRSSRGKATGIPWKQVHLRQIDLLPWSGVVMSFMLTLIESRVIYAWDPLICERTYRLMDRGRWGVAAVWVTRVAEEVKSHFASNILRFCARRGWRRLIVHSWKTLCRVNASILGALIHDALPNRSTRNEGNSLFERRISSNKFASFLMALLRMIYHVVGVRRGMRCDWMMKTLRCARC